MSYSAEIYLSEYGENSGIAAQTFPKGLKKSLFSKFKFYSNKNYANDMGSIIMVNPKSGGTRRSVEHGTRALTALG